LVLLLSITGCGEVGSGEGPDAGDSMTSAESSVGDTSLEDADSTAESAVDTSVDAPCPSTASAYAARFAAAICEPLDSCCKTAALPNDVDKCKATATARLLVAWDPALCSGAKFDDSQFDECVTRLRAYTATCRDEWDVYRATFEFCYRALSGPGKPGESCKTQFDCAQPSAPGYTSCASHVSASGTVSMCTEYDFVGEGADCGGGFEPVVKDCEPGVGLYCDGHCKKLPTDGQSCAVAACAKGLVCNAAKTCVMPAADGAACTTATPCSVDSLCTSGICKALGDVGQPCTADSDCKSTLGGCRSAKCAPGSFGGTSLIGSTTGPCIP
jgi:hypothetical protein